MYKHHTRHTPKTQYTDIAASDQSDKYQIFYSWLVQNGYQPRFITLGTSASGLRSVYAKHYISQNMIIMSIPRNLLITVDMGKNTVVGKKIIQTNSQFENISSLFIALFLLEDSTKENSFFEPYYQMFPKSQLNIPVFWTDSELDWLRGSRISEDIVKRKNLIQMEYDYICRLCPPFREKYAYHKYIWFRTYVFSRCFAVKIDGNDTSVMVPYADMCNHSNSANTSWEFDNRRNAFTVTALNKIVGGNEICDTYGTKSNRVFLQNYGFCLEDNVGSNGVQPNDVAVKLERIYADELYDTKYVLCGDNAKLFDSDIYISIQNNYEYELFFALLRIIVADEHDLNALALSYDGSSEYTLVNRAKRHVSINNERAAMRMLQTMMQTELDKYERTLEADIELLKYGTLLPLSNQRNAVLLVSNICLCTIYACTFFICILYDVY
jgi:histone-lysine N-methyltransferase SETD3